MIITRLRVLAVAAVMLTNIPLAFAVQDATLMSASALLKANDAKGAYNILEPLEADRSGDVDFDYLFGIAAVDSGNVTRGVFALERVLATQPDNAEARAEIAKAYYMLGENDTAKTEFESVLQQNPPEGAKATINKFLSAIDKNLGLATRYAAYLDFSIGHDSNINSATGASSVALPAFGGIIVQLAGGAQQAGANYFNVSGGASFQYPFSKGWSLFGSVNGASKVNSGDKSNTAFDTDSLDFNVGGQYKLGPDAYTLAYQDSSYYVGNTDNNKFRRAFGVNGQWQHDLDQVNQVSLYFQAGRLEYPGQNVRDSNRYLGGVGWGHAFAGDKSPVIFASVYGGVEDVLASNVDNLGDHFIGVRAGGQIVYNPKVVLFANASYENREYGGPDPLFLSTRSDDQYDFALGLRYLPGYSWTIKPQFSYTKNDSNIALYAYDRYLFSISFRHDFNW